MSADMLATYEFFALTSDGRVDRGFRKAMMNDHGAIGFGESIEGAAMVEVRLGKKLITKIRFINGTPTVIGST